MIAEHSRDEVLSRHSMRTGTEDLLAILDEVTDVVRDPSLEERFPRIQDASDAGFGRLSREDTAVSSMRVIGSLREQSLAEIAQKHAFSRKTGILVLASGPHRGTVAFTDGRVSGARAYRLWGEPAFHRMMVWDDGKYRMCVGPHDEPSFIGCQTMSLIQEGRRRMSERLRVLQRLPPLHQTLIVDPTSFLERMHEFPDELSAFIVLFDGTRTLGDVVDSSRLGELESLQAASRLFVEGILFESNTPDIGPLPADLLEVARWLADGEAGPLGPPNHDAMPAPLSDMEKTREVPFELTQEWRPDVTHDRVLATTREFFPDEGDGEWVEV